MTNQPNLTEQEIVTELQKSNKDLRNKLQVAEQDLLDIAKYSDSVTISHLLDLQHFLQVLTLTDDLDIIHTVIETMHDILDEMSLDCQLIAEQGFDELKERQKQHTTKRGGRIPA